MPDPAETPAPIERSPRDLGELFRQFRAALGEDSSRADSIFALAAVTLGVCLGITIAHDLGNLWGGIVVLIAYPVLAKLLLRPIRAAANFAVGTLSRDDNGAVAMVALLWPVGFPTVVPFALFVGLIRRVP